jgi:N-glycosylase/DNA lyase
VDALSETRESLRRAAIRVCEELIARRPPSRPWRGLHEGRLWTELASCILGSCVPYELASAAVRRLRSQGLFDIDRALRNLHAFEEQVATALSGPVRIVGGGASTRRYRFPFSRARHLRCTVESIYGRGSSLREILKSAADCKNARISIMSSALGAGPKQASLFLRNIGYSADLAVLDTHVLQYMRWMGLTDRAESSVQNLKTYEDLEHAFRDHVRELGFTVGEYDLAVWITMRAFRNEATA